MRTSELERLAAEAWLAGLSLSIIGALITFGLLYLVIRLGVRDGMRDAQRDLRAGREPTRHRTTSTAHLPDMRAD